MLPFIQPQLVIASAATAEIGGTPFDVEDTIWRSAGKRGENASWASGELVVPIREYGVVVGSPRQADVGKGRIGGRELGIAVGRQIDAGESLVVQGVTEGKRDSGYQIICVIPDIGRAGHDAPADLRYGVVVWSLATPNCVIP